MKRSLVALGLLFLTSTAAPAQQASDTVAPEGATGLAAAKITTAREHMVAAAHPLAAEAGEKVLADGGSAIDGRTTRHPGYAASQKIRKRIEEGFGWLKTVGGLRKTKLIGRAKLSAQLLLGFSVYNLIRLGSLSGWWRGSHV